MKAEQSWVTPLGSPSFFFSLFYWWRWVFLGDHNSSLGMTWELMICPGTRVWATGHLRFGWYQFLRMGRGTRRRCRERSTWFLIGILTGWRYSSLQEFTGIRLTLICYFFSSYNALWWSVGNNYVGRRSGFRVRSLMFPSLEREDRRQEYRGIWPHRIEMPMGSLLGPWNLLLLP